MTAPPPGRVPTIRLRYWEHSDPLLSRAARRPARGRGLVAAGRRAVDGARQDHLEKTMEPPAKLQLKAEYEVRDVRGE